jgi:hypothetical protein
VANTFKAVTRCNHLLLTIKGCCCCCWCAVCCREWNTNTRNAHLAQVLLQAVLKSHSPEQILEVPGGCYKSIQKLDRILQDPHVYVGHVR